MTILKATACIWAALGLFGFTRYMLFPFLVETDFAADFRDAGVIRTLVSGVLMAVCLSVFAICFALLGPSVFLINRISSK